MHKLPIETYLDALQKILIVLFGTIRHWPLGDDKIGFKIGLKPPRDINKTSLNLHFPISSALDNILLLYIILVAVPLASRGSIFEGIWKSRKIA